MKKEVKNRWVKALRSGKYKKAKERLACEDGSFCALGVLCDLYVHSAEGRRNRCRWDLESDELVIGEVAHDVSGELPDEVARWAGLSETDPVVTKNGRTIINVNDGSVGNVCGVKRYPRSFKQIADMIEKRL